MALILFGMCIQAPLDAAAQVPASGREHLSYIVYLHPVASDVDILVDDLKIYTTGSVFGSWCYQFNVTSFLDTRPRTLEIRVRPGNNEQAYCDVEVRKIQGDPAGTTLLAQKTIRGADLENWNREHTATTLELALPAKSTPPLWTHCTDTDLGPAVRDTYTGLIKEIFTAIQKGDFDSLMALIDPALTNQALMEGAPPDLLKQAMRGALKRYCIPNIHVAETRPAFYSQTYADRMAPLNFDGMHYFRMKDAGSEGAQGNLYLPEEPIQFYTKKNHLFAAQVFLSSTNDGSKKWYVSRFVFGRTE